MPWLDPTYSSAAAGAIPGVFPSAPPSGAAAPPPPLPASLLPSLALTPLRGYLLLSAGRRRVLFNVTGVPRAGQGIPAIAAVADGDLGAWRGQLMWGSGWG